MIRTALSGVILGAFMLPIAVGSTMVDVNETVRALGVTGCLLVGIVWLWRQFIVEQKQHLHDIKQDRDAFVQVVKRNAKVVEDNANQARRLAESQDNLADAIVSWRKSCPLLSGNEKKGGDNG